MSRFVPAPGMERMIARQPSIATQIGKVTRRVEAAARDLSRPVSSRFADGLDSDVGIDETGVVGRVNANWFASAFIELGTAQRPPQAILRRALDSLRSTR